MGDGSELLAQTDEFGRFALLEQLSLKQDCAVHRARETTERGMPRLLVLKRLLSPAAADPVRRRAFERDAVVSASCVHACLRAAYELGEQDGVPYIVLEHIAGLDARRLLLQVRRADERALAPEAAASIAVQVCAGLEHAHARRIAHCGVVPSNVLVSYSGEVKLIGWSRATPRGQRCAVPFGAPARFGYHSPEILAGHPVDARTDVYALGACLHEWLLGSPPPSDPDDASDGAADEAARAMQSAAPELMEIIDLAMQRERTSRFATLGEMRCALDSYLALREQEYGAAQLADFVRRYCAERMTRERDELREQFSDATRAPVRTSRRGHASQPHRVVFNTEHEIGLDQLGPASLAGAPRGRASWWPACMALVVALGIGSSLEGSDKIASTSSWSVWLTAPARASLPASAFVVGNPGRERERARSGPAVAPHASVALLRALGQPLTGKILPVTETSKRRSSAAAPALAAASADRAQAAVRAPRVDAERAAAMPPQASSQTAVVGSPQVPYRAPVAALVHPARDRAATWSLFVLLPLVLGPVFFFAVRALLAMLRAARLAGAGAQDDDYAHDPSSLAAGDRPPPLEPVALERLRPAAASPPAAGELVRAWRVVGNALDALVRTARLRDPSAFAHSRTLLAHWSSLPDRAIELQPTKLLITQRESLQAGAEHGRFVLPAFMAGLRKIELRADATSDSVLRLAQELGALKPDLAAIAEFRDWLWCDGADGFNVSVNLSFVELADHLVSDAEEHTALAVRSAAAVAEWNRIAQLAATELDAAAVREEFRVPIDLFSSRVADPQWKLAAVDVEAMRELCDDPAEWSEDEIATVLEHPQLRQALPPQRLAQRIRALIESSAQLDGRLLAFLATLGGSKDEYATRLLALLEGVELGLAIGGKLVLEDGEQPALQKLLTSAADTTVRGVLHALLQRAAGEGAAMRMALGLIRGIGWANALARLEPRAIAGPTAASLLRAAVEDRVAPAALSAFVDQLSLRVAAVALTAHLELAISLESSTERLLQRSPVAAARLSRALVANARGARLVGRAIARARASGWPLKLLEPTLRALVGAGHGAECVVPLFRRRGLKPGVRLAALRSLSTEPALLAHAIRFHPGEWFEPDEIRRAIRGLRAAEGANG